MSHSEYETYFYIFSESSLKFMLRNQTYLNNSIVAINDIGEGDSALLCVTDKPDCCKPPDGTAQGEFYYPNRSAVSPGNTNPLYKNRGPQVVRLNRKINVLSPTGVYRCEIPDTNGMNGILYINIINTAGLKMSPTYCTEQSPSIQSCYCSFSLINVLVLCFTQ